jgi:hypothetical protein
MRSAVAFDSFWKHPLSILTKRVRQTPFRPFVTLLVPLIVLPVSNRSVAQTPTQTPPVSAMGGSNTGGVHEVRRGTSPHHRWRLR